MAKVSGNTPKTTRKTRPAVDPEVRLQQLVAKTVDLIEQQLDEGTASSQIMTQILKYGTEKAKLENEKLRHENELLRAKTELTKSQKTSEELMSKALVAFRKYSGHSGDDEEDDYYDY